MPEQKTPESFADLVRLAREVFITTPHYEDHGQRPMTAFIAAHTVLDRVEGQVAMAKLLLNAVQCDAPVCYDYGVATEDDWRKDIQQSLASSAAAKLLEDKVIKQADKERRGL